MYTFKTQNYMQHLFERLIQNTESEYEKKKKKKKWKLFTDWFDS